MRRILTMTTAAVLMALAAGGCASATTDQELTFPEPALTVTIQESGKDFRLKVGQYAKISLKENPTTGYSWFFRTDTGKPGPQPKTGLPVELAGERLLPAESDLVGAPQTREVMIKAEPNEEIVGLSAQRDRRIDCKERWDIPQRQRLCRIREDNIRTLFR